MRSIRRRGARAERGGEGREKRTKREDQVRVGQVRRRPNEGATSSHCPRFELKSAQGNARPLAQPSALVFDQRGRASKSTKDQGENAVSSAPKFKWISSAPPHFTTKAFVARRSRFLTEAAPHSSIYSITHQGSRHAAPQEAKPSMKREKGQERRRESERSRTPPPLTPPPFYSKRRTIAQRARARHSTTMAPATSQSAKARGRRGP